MVGDSLNPATPLPNEGRFTRKRSVSTIATQTLTHNAGLVISARRLNAIRDPFKF